MFKKKEKTNNIVTDGTIGSDLSFAASEAYKLLRTNITLSLPNGVCNVIGITSSGPSEGKSTTAINTAYAFAENGKKVLLIEADMRKPGISDKINIDVKPGLSNFLLNLNELSACTKKCKLHTNITVLTAGDTPPNPSELLGTGRLDALINAARNHFDMIIFDLPPINVVTDALVIANKLDGTLIVVRSDVTTKREVAEVVNAFEFAKAKVLGFVLTDTKISNKSYGKYKKKGYGYYTK